MLSKQILNNLWQSGFCKTLIELLRETAPGVTGSVVRMEIMQAHLDTKCTNCTHANTIRGIEQRTAIAMGDTAIALFNRGGNIKNLPGFRKAFKQVFESGVACGQVDRAVAAWLTRMVPQRAGQTYPYIEEDNGSKAN